MDKYEQIIIVNYDTIIQLIKKLSNWKTIHYVNNENSPIFEIDIDDDIYQKEQSWIKFCYPNNYDEVTKDILSLETYKNEEYNCYYIPLEAALKWLILNDMLPAHESMIVKGG